MATMNAHQAYKTTGTNTATPAELTLMLYNGCIKFIKLAKLAIVEKNVPERHTNIIKAQNIIRELRYTLNMNIELSKGYAQLYDYLLDRLIEANTKNDEAILDEVAEFVTEFRDTWKQAMKIANKK